MEILNKLGDTAKDLGDKAKGLVSRAQEVRKKSSSLKETAKIKYEVSKLEKEMENNFAAIGLLVYQNYQGEEGVQEEVDKLLEATQELETEAKALEDKIAELQPKEHVCPKCEEELPEGGIYCSYCGIKVIED